ncbi:MAG: flagellar hook-associated protein FlgK [Nitratireductor sp.]
MTLSTALRSASSSLLSTSQQAAVTSRNIAGIGDANYIRREVQVVTGLHGSTRVEVQRNVDQALYDSSILANSRYAKSNAISGTLDRLAIYQELNNFSQSPSNLLSSLKAATEFAAATPADASGLNSLVENARDFANSLNASYTQVLESKAQIDSDINASVQTINTKLAQLEDLNDQIVDGTRLGDDVFDQMDARDKIINDLSDEIGVNVIYREDNDAMLTLNNGVILFDRQARQVEFQPMPAYGASTQGNHLTVDGVAVTGVDSRMPIYTGAIAGHIEVRDTHLNRQQVQLDEIARGLIEAYAEQDQVGGGKPALAGLFTWDGGPGVPNSGILSPGIAGSLKVNELVDPTNGGNVTLLRDGAINGDNDYLSNTAGGVSFADRLYELSAGFDSARTFDAISGLGSGISLQEYADQSLDQFNASRQSARDNTSYLSDLATGFKESLQNENGPNLDYEMSRLLEIERAYQATAKIISAVDGMLEDLMQVV